jgi:hypothetical protein
VVDREQFYAEVRRRLDLPDYEPYTAFDPLVRWVMHDTQQGLGVIGEELPAALRAQGAQQLTRDGELKLIGTLLRRRY